MNAPPPDDDGCGGNTLFVVSHDLPTLMQAQLSGADEDRALCPHDRLQSVLKHTRSRPPDALASEPRCKLPNGIDVFESSLTTALPCHTTTSRPPSNGLAIQLALSVHWRSVRAV